jgi:tetratricopeptide (TPR) repeat protein
MEDFATLEVRILPLEDDGYPVELELNQERQLGRGLLDPALQPDLHDFPIDVAGTTLFNWLTHDLRIRSAVDVARGAATRMRLRLRIDAAAPALHALPWETLRLAQPDGDVIELAANAATPFSRYLTTADAPTAYVQPPLRMLVAIAAPDGLEELGFAAIDADEEWAHLQSALDTSGVELVRLAQPCTLTALEQAVRDDIHIVHVIAHGLFDQRNARASLVLADTDNQPLFVADADIAAMFDRLVHDAAALRVLFLAACESATRSPADAFRGLAPQLIRAGIPAVIAMQELVPVATARTFSRVFYQRLLEHGMVDLAANEARATLMTAALPGAAIPVLFMRLADGRLFAPPAPRLRAGTMRWLVPLLAVIALAVLVIAGTLIYPAVDARLHPSKMSGGFKVAVADFGLLHDGNMAASTLGTDLSKTLYDTLEQEYAAVADDSEAIGPVAFWHDSLPRAVKNWKLGMVEGATPDERMANAAALATRANADMLIYGYLTDDESPEGLALEFYFRAPAIAGEPDAADGGHRLGRPIPSYVPVADAANATLALQAISPSLVERANAMFWLTQAMSFEFANQPEQALAILRTVEPQLETWHDDDGKEVFHTFLGRAALFARDFDEAIRAGEEAIGINPDYPNARAVELAPTSPWPDVAPYAQMNLGLAERVLALAQIFDGRADDAAATLARSEEHLQTAMAAFDPTTSPQYVAWTHMGLGLNYRLQAFLEESAAWNANAAGDTESAAQHTEVQVGLLQETITAYQACIDQREATASYPVFQKKVLQCSCVPYRASAQAALEAIATPATQ